MKMRKNFRTEVHAKTAAFAEEVTLADSKAVASRQRFQRQRPMEPYGTEESDGTGGSGLRMPS
jgi:hypothetical protein